MFVLISFVLLKVAIVAVVTLAFVICAEALVSPVDKLSVADVKFVETAFVLTSVAIVAVVTLAFVIWADALVTPVERFIVPLEMFVAIPLTLVRAPEMLMLPPVYAVATIVPATSRAADGLVVPIPMRPSALIMNCVPEP
jgi:hypothetical protein